MSGLDVSAVSVCFVSTHRPAEESTARAALVLDHAGPVVLTQNQQMDGIGGPHHFLLHHSPLTATQLWREIKKEFTYCLTSKQYNNFLWLNKFLVTG